ncbi:MAG TPA: methionine--tRNA ligase subunit beta [Candidatus Paceibacterota bacterium]|nr:methionine--tRNA ligase subunit beta [Candidatus Paceibacterota bacterium]
MTVSYEDFAALDLRAATVTAAERVEGSDKLIRLELDLGTELGSRQVVAGVGKAYGPEALVGSQIVIVANLAPRKLMGLESNGMLLAAHGEDGTPILLRPDARAPEGSKVS